MKLRAVFRWTLRGVLLLLMIAPFVAWGTFVYVKQRITAELAAQLGSEVSIERLELTPRRIALHGIRAADRAAAAPWLTIAQATPSLTLWDALQGRVTFETLDVVEPRLTLTFDAAGRLVSPQPSNSARKVPCDRIEVQNATIEIRQPGRTPLVASRIDATLNAARDRFQLQADVGDLLASEWTVSSSGTLQPFTATLEAATERVTLATRQFTELPLVEPTGIADFPFEAIAALRLNLATSPEQSPEYRIEVALASLRLELPAGDAPISALDGRVVIENGLVTIQQLTGELAGGDVRIAGECDFRAPTWTGRLQCQIADIELADVPLETNLPDDTGGTLGGEVAVDFEYQGGRTTLRGTGDFVIDPVTLFGDRGQPVQLAIDLWQAEQAAPRGAWQLDGQATVDLAFDDVDPRRWLRAIPPADRPPPADWQASLESSRASWSGRLVVPLASYAQLETYEFAGRVAVDQLAWNKLQFRGLNAGLSFRQGIATIEQLKSQFAGGELAGNLTADLRPGGELAIDLAANEIPLRSLRDAVADGTLPFDVPPSLDRTPSLDGMLPLDGLASGAVAAHVAMTDWQRLDAWQAEGRLRSPALSFGAHQIEQVATALALDDGQLQLNDLAAQWRGAQVRGSGEVELHEALACRLRFSLDDFSLDDLTQLADMPQLPAAGSLSVKGQIAGELRPLTWSAEGQVATASLRVADVPVEVAEFTWKLDAEQFRIAGAELRWLDVAAYVSADLPLDSNQALRISGRFRNVTDAVRQRFAADVPLRLTQPASGSFQLAAHRDASGLQADISLQAAEWQVAEVAIQEPVARLRLRDERLTAELTGDALGGRIELNGQGSFKLGTTSASDVRGELTAEGIRLRQVYQALKLRSRTQLPDGTAAASFAWQLSPGSFEPTGQGQIVLRDVRWQGRSLASEIRSSAELSGNQLTLPDVGFRYGGGQVGASLNVRLDQNVSGAYTLNLDNIRSDELLAAWPGWARDFRSRVHGRFRGQFATGRVTGAGQLALDRGSVHGVTVSSLQAPVAWTLDPATNSGRARVQIRRAVVSRGTVTGDIDLSWNRRVSISSNLSIANVELRQVARGFQSLNDQLGGRLTGEVQIDGREIRSLSDLTGTYQFTLANAQVFRLPVLQALPGSFILASPSERFSETQLQGRVHRGVIFVDRMTMVAAGLHMYVQGQVTTSGQLNLDVTADTAELAAAGIATGILRPTDFLLRRLIFLHLSGTAQAPIITPRTDKLLAQEVELFFLAFLIP